MRVGLVLILSVLIHLKQRQWRALPETDGNVSSVHSILSIVLLDLIEMLRVLISDTLEDDSDWAGEVPISELSEWHSVRLVGY